MSGPAVDVAALIHAIVRQTMVLVAQLATTAGMRAPLANVANQVFLDLVRELEAQGVGRKVIADMFGLALRSYHAKVRRLSGSATDRGYSLWEAVYTFIQEKGPISRQLVLKRFDRDEPLMVRGVLNDLTESGVVFRTGRGDRTVYRVAHGEELGLVEDDDPVERAALLVWVVVHRQGRATRASLLADLGLPEDQLDQSLERLIADARVKRLDTGAEETFTTSECVIPLESSLGWEAAVLDHFQAMVVAIGIKLRRGSARARREDAIGGSTYTFDVWEGHPLAEEALGLLAEVRQRASSLRQRIDQHNHGSRSTAEQISPSAPEQDGALADSGGAVRRVQRVSFYVGQCVISDEDEDTEE